MKKFKLFALPVMLGAMFFVFGEPNFAKAEVSACFPPNATCATDGNCCSRICCQLHDTREECEIVPNPSTCY